MINILLSKKIFASLICFAMIIAIIDVIIPGITFFSDEHVYIGEAKSIVETGQFSFGTSRIPTMPMTGLIYSSFYKIFDSDASFIKSLRVMQAFLHILTAIGAASIAFSIFKNRMTSLIVLYSMIVYPSFLAYQCILMTETLFVFSIVWGFAFLYLWEEDLSKYFLCAMSMFMFSLYVRPVITIIMPALIYARGIVITQSWKRRMKYVILSCILFMLCLSPWWVRNWNIFGRLVLFAPSAGNLYLGNNPANKTAGIDWRTDIDPHVVARIQSLGDEIEIDRAYFEEAKRYILENKTVFLHNMWLKFKRFWNFTSNYSGNIYPKAFLAYNIALLMSWGIACPLGFASFFINWKRWKELLPIYIFIVYYVFIHIVVIASLRYRLPIEPFFIIIGADCFTRLYCKMEKRFMPRKEVYTSGQQHLLL